MAARSHHQEPTLSSKATYDDKERLATSKRFGAHLGLTPPPFLLDEINNLGNVLKAFDQSLNAKLDTAARSLL